MYHPILRPGAQRQIKKLGEADLVIGLPTYKNARVAAEAAAAALAGAHRYNPSIRTVLINADAGSDAATRQAIAGLAHNGIITGRYDGPFGQGSAVAAILDAALALDAKAVVILDSATQTITPDWIGGLAHLILENKADLVVARYRWALPQGALSDLLVYPLFRALWGKNIRHPAAPDMALSPALALALLDEDIWETEVAAYGLPPWLSTYAALGPWRVAQSALGEKQNLLMSGPSRSAKSDARRADIYFKSQFHNITSAMLRLVYEYRAHWEKVNQVDSVSTLTEFASPVISDINRAELDPIPLLDKLAIGWIEYRSLWQQILTPDNLAWLEAVAALPPDRFYFPCDLWTKIVYDYAVVFNKGECDPQQVIDSLLPLYQGRLAAFTQEIAGLSVVGHEGTVAAQAVEFEEQRAYLQNRWQAYQPV